MKTQVLIMVLLIVILSGCTDSRVYGLYVNEKNGTLNFMDDGKVLVSSGLNSALDDYKIHNGTIIITWMGMSSTLEIKDNGKTLVGSGGRVYKKVE